MLPTNSRGAYQLAGRLRRNPTVDWCEKSRETCSRSAAAAVREAYRWSRAYTSWMTEDLLSA